MNAASMKLHEQLLRLAKGVLKAWEEWIEAQKRRE